MAGRESLIQYPLGNKLRRLDSVVEARHLLNGDTTKNRGTKYVKFTNLK